MKRPEQESFLPFKLRRSHGGNADPSHSKRARVVPTRAPIHLVMRSTYATGVNSLLKFAKPIRRLVDAQAQRFGVKSMTMRMAAIISIWWFVRIHAQRFLIFSDL